ncbi:zf-HC2 domain-containing protein [Marinobacter salicampi]|uniref:zf-HC2 domain-containing protein n=1 Tax=Marinobacter salicampi TaxID=435907 RepID=UPI001407B5FA|nr:zf-HC2 domain-containing protein [Marinobacter salicampi]
MLMCRDLARIASDYIDGELSTTSHLSVKMHLLMCGHCRTFIGNLRASIELLNAQSISNINDELLERIHHDIEAELRNRRAARPDS